MKTFGRWKTQSLETLMNSLQQPASHASAGDFSSALQPCVTAITNRQIPDDEIPTLSVGERPARMPRQLSLFSCLLGLGITGIASSSTQAQNFSIDWYSIDGGGGTSAGGVFSLSGTIGQPDAGVTMTSGGFSLTGGFWSLFAIQTPGAPRLSVTRVSATTARLSWSMPADGFVLQETSDVHGANWVNVPLVVMEEGPTRSVSVPSGAVRRFYRLFKP